MERTRETWIKELIDGVCAAPGSNDVVLALDLSQIDTDRGLRVYGNAPYSELMESIKGLKPSRRVFILTSSAPGQKSWLAEGLGNSIFAYYLQKGLSGGVSQPEGVNSSTITIHDLHRYVLNHVRDWVRSNRRDSIQTPMLLTVPPDSKESTTLSLSAIPKTQPSAPSDTESGPGTVQVSKIDDTAKSRSKEKSEPAALTKDASADQRAQPKKDEFETLIAEWDKYEKLKAERPYRYLPGAWRSYESALLRAERRVRAVWLDPQEPGAQDRAVDGLERARIVREELDNKLKERKTNEDSVPFRSVLGEIDNKGKWELNEALTALTGRASEGKLMPPPKPQEPPAEPAKGSGQPQPATESVKAAPPPAFPKITPGTYLELQLPAWAHTFETHFNLEQTGYFRLEGARGQVLRALVRARADAELAMERDRRGLGWITSFLRGGDKIRRNIQDELLSGAKDDDLGSQWKKSAEDVGSIYQQALDCITEFGRARQVWEDAASDLPSLVEWAVRRESYRSNTSPAHSDGSLEVVKRALIGFQSLSKLLDDKPFEDDGEFANKTEEWLTGLGKTTDDTANGLKDLRHRFDEENDQLALGVRDWTALDTALRTPLVAPTKRKALLSKLRTLAERAVQLSPKSANDPGDATKPAPADPGFRFRAAELARLDLTLSGIASDPIISDDHAAGFNELNEALSSETGSFHLGNFTAAVEKGSMKLKSLDLSAASTPSRSPKDLMALLAEMDRKARLLDPWNFNQAGASDIVDKIVEQYWRSGRYTALVFHFQRLWDDYAEDRVLGELADKIAALVTSLAIEDAPKRPNPGFPPLDVKVDPTLPLRKWTGTLNVATHRPNNKTVLIPPGRAFVGLVVPPELKVAGVPSESMIPGSLERVGSRQPEADGTKTYQLAQRSYDASTASPVRVALFYRGRVIDDAEHLVDVMPDRSSDKVTVRISQDIDAWKLRYDGAPVNKFKDQFDDHPNKGYVHRGGSLDYMLTITNHLPEELKLNYLIELTDPGDPKNDEKLE